MSKEIHPLFDKRGVLKLPTEKTGMQIFLANTGGGQRSRLFHGLRLNRYIPDYNKNFLTDLLIKLKNQSDKGVSSWGYNFDWQARAFFQPKNTPTVVASSFIAKALLEAYAITKNENTLNTVLNIESFILNDLNQSLDEDNDICFSYSPIDKTQVYNASLLGARLLTSIYKYTQNPAILNKVTSAFRYVAKKQKQDGSWSYSNLNFHSWIDNFHTGFIIECFNNYKSYTNDSSFDDCILKGTEFYLKTFFTEQGMPKYYSNQVFPIDVHSTAQLAATAESSNTPQMYLPTLKKVFSWTINNMQHNKGYFYYQKNKLYTNKIAYMRWSQAWMFYGFSIYLSLLQKSK